jgi:hypothetical protein
MGFEQRIQERRYNALLETMKAAVAAGDAAGARAALDEARELRPAAAELDAYELRISAIPPPPAVTATRYVGQWRPVSAVALLLAGIGLVTGIDYLRSQPAEPSVATETSIPAFAPADAIATDTIATEPVVTLPVTSQPDEAIAEEPRGTTGRAGFERAEDDEPLEAVPAAIAPARVVEERAPLPVGEVPDDFVYPGRSLAPAPVPSNVPADVLPPRSSAIVTLPASPPPAAAAGAAAAAAAARLEEGRVTDVLNAYARAYGRLDAAAARAVWPTVNERALARAFASLESQNVSFEDCSIELDGARANASCRGQASYVGKVGSREPRVEPRQWRFELRQDEGGWKIQNAEARGR